MFAPDAAPVSNAPPCQPEAAHHRYWRALYLFSGAITLAGLLIRATVADRWLFCSTIFYATPLPLLACGGAIAVLCTNRLKWFGQMSFWCVLLVVTLAVWGLSDWKRHPQRSTEDSISVLFWNVARRSDTKPAAEYITRINADVVALVEAGPANADRRKYWQENCPGYDVSMLGGGLMLLTKGTSGQATAGELARASIYRLIRCQVKGQEVTCAIVDLKSDPFYSRGPILAGLDAVLKPYHDENLIVLGDFNTPVDSVHYAPLRAQLTEVFETVGTGYAPTWPAPVPVLWLDQVWVNERIEPLGCVRLPPVNSDHHPVLCRIRVRDRIESGVAP